MINATIAVNAAAPAWSPQQGIIFYNGCHDIPATSPLLHELLEPLGTTSTPTTQAFAPSLLLTEDWPQHTLSSAAVTFFTTNAAYAKDDLLFGTLENRTSSTPSKVATTLNKRITAQLAAGQVHNRSLQVILLTGVLPNATPDGLFYTPAPLLPLVDLLDALLLSGQAHMRFLALDLHPLPTAPDHNASPSATLLGRPSLQDTVSPTTVTFLGNLGH
jgi:hypothetical protein